MGVLRPRQGPLGNGRGDFRVSAVSAPGIHWVVTGGAAERPTMHGTAPGKEEPAPNAHSTGPGARTQRHWGRASAQLPLRVVLTRSWRRQTNTDRVETAHSSCLAGQDGRPSGRG